MRILFFLLILFTNSLEASPVKWFAGSLVLNDGAVRVGEMAVKGEFDIVLFREGELVTVYAAHRIQSLNIYDRQASINRKFISISDTLEAVVQHRLYEIVLRGEISVWRRQRELSPGIDDRLDFNYYVFWNNTTIPLSKFRTRIFPKLMNIASTQLTGFMHQQKLNSNRASDAIRIIEFYNHQETFSTIAAK
ncbi:MAG: hypothetical protein JNM57_12975 [Cyclobacteriaceae bacterium]|nr:hypothetical protein [Cyclobacteriaceae bacterium]